MLGLQKYNSFLQLCLGSFIQNEFCKVSSMCSIYQVIIPVHCFIFHCMFISYFAYLFVSLWTFGLLSAMNNAIINIFVQGFMWTYILSSVETISGNGTILSWISFIFNHLREWPTVFPSSCTFYISIEWRKVSLLLCSCHHLLFSLSIFF